MSIHTHTQHVFNAIAQRYAATAAALSAPITLTFQGANAATLFLAGIALMAAALGILATWGDLRVLLFAAFVWMMCGGGRLRTTPFYQGSLGTFLALAATTAGAVAVILSTFEPQGAASMLASFVFLMATSITRRAHLGARRP